MMDYGISDLSTFDLEQEVAKAKAFIAAPRQPCPVKELPKLPHVTLNYSVSLDTLTIEHPHCREPRVVIDARECKDSDFLELMTLNPIVLGWIAAASSVHMVDANGLCERGMWGVLNRPFGKRARGLRLVFILPDRGRTEARNRRAEAYETTIANAVRNIWTFEGRSAHVHHEMPFGTHFYGIRSATPRWFTTITGPERDVARWPCRDTHLPGAWSLRHVIGASAFESVARGDLVRMRGAGNGDRATILRATRRMGGNSPVDICWSVGSEIEHLATVMSLGRNPRVARDDVRGLLVVKEPTAFVPLVEGQWSDDKLVH